MLKLLLLFVSLQEPPPALPPQQPPAADSTILDPVHGTLRVKYRYRGTSDDSDSDLYEVISLTYGNPEKDFATAAMTLRLAEDTDGNRSVQGYYPFTSLDDRYKSFATQRLYTAYLDLRPEEGRILIRGGRQILDDFPEAVPMDGGLFRYQVGTQVLFSVFGGLPVNPFESSPQGDSMYGASAEWRPELEGRARYRVEYLHIRDDNSFGLHKDDLVGFSVDEGSGPLSVYARYTLLEGESRDLVARVTGAVPDAEFQVQFQGTYVFHQIQALSYPLDPYASFMMDLQPYVDLALRASKGFGSLFSLEAAFTSRQLVGDGVETTYNHEFKRVELAPSLRNWPMEGFLLRISGDYWNSSTTDFWTLGGDLSIPLRRDITFSVGSSYALYSVDAFTGEEHDRVRLYMFALKWQTDRSSFIEARFTLEENAIDSFRTLEVGFRHAF